MRWILLSFFLIASSAAYSQSGIVNWANASLEGTPLPGTIPEGWESHNFEGETPPDTQPCNCGGVRQKPFHGDTYVSMLVQEDNSWESVGQLLERELETGWKYEFTLHACRSPRYYLPGKDNPDQLVNASKPVILRLWGGTYEDPFAELLTETKPVDNLEWSEQVFSFIPKQSVSYLTLEAYYDRGSAYAYNGNVLIDNLSPIYQLRVKGPPSRQKEVVTYDRGKENPLDYYTTAKPVQKDPVMRPPSSGKWYLRRSNQKRIENNARLNRRELILQAQHEMEIAKRAEEGQSQEDIMLYDDPTIVERKLNRQVESLKTIPSNAEAFNVPAEIRTPISRMGPVLLDPVYAVDETILRELAGLMEEWPGYTLIVAVNAPMQGMRDKVAWDIDLARQRLNIPENVMAVEQYTGQNTYFKDWLWKPEGQRLMMRLMPRKEQN